MKRKDLQCKECAHYTERDYAHGYCKKVENVVCGLCRPCLDFERKEEEAGEGMRI